MKIMTVDKEKPYEIKAGDIVMLRSGGPAMTVTAITSATEGINKKNCAYCAYFDKTPNRIVQRQCYLAVESLVRLLDYKPQLMA